MKALLYIKDPAARVLIVRESYPTLKLSGGLWDESQGIYSHFGGIPKIQRLTWEFPNGATIQFAALPDRIEEWRGLQASHILVDEAASFKESDILFLLSRLRSAKYKGHLNLTMTCNPDKSSFLFKWVEFCLDEEGIPKENTHELTRWFITLGGSIKWADSREELWEKHGEGLIDGVTFIPLKFRFIPLTVYDNPVLLKTNPLYLANLLAQPKVDQLRYLYGSWTSMDTGAMYFNREWCEIVDYPPTDCVSRVRAYDLAATEVTEMSSFDPDFTVGIKMSRDRFGVYYIEDMVRYQKRTDAVLKEIVKVARQDGLDVQVSIPQDAGGAGKTAVHFYCTNLAENGVYARKMMVSGHSSKLTRFKPFCALAEAGNVKVLKAEWNDDFFSELEAFKGERSRRGQHDDIVDAVADAATILMRMQSMPTFVIPSMVQPSPIATIG